MILDAKRGSLGLFKRDCKEVVVTYARSLTMTYFCPTKSLLTNRDDRQNALQWAVRAFLLLLWNESNRKLNGAKRVN